MLKIQEICLNPNWEEILSAPPYCLNIIKKDSRILFKYNQISSDFSLEAVREARGIILEKETFKVVCYPLYKFFNYGEPFSAELNWKSGISCQEKVDGSLIKAYYYDGKWKVATNSTIDAEDAELNCAEYSNFRQLFDAAARKEGLVLDDLDKNYSYVFELYGPFNRIVVPYDVIGLKHLSSRNMNTLKEEELNLGISKPLIYSYKTLDECIAAAAQFNFTKEGFVIVDSFYNRLKCKSPSYVKAHRLVNNHCLNLERTIDLIRTGEAEEFFSYFPQYEDYLKKVEKGCEKVEESCANTQKLAEVAKLSCANRADFAQKGKESGAYLPFYFLAYDNDNFNYKNYLNTLSLKQYCRLYNALNE